ncbi:MAG: IPT/TIG domain-containing protein, partial [Verrucomicrobia bacterium]|nr:IPT/TIG domain-containing protein [Verrucomicrobiota bacterium]
FSATAGSASDPQSFTVLGFGLSNTIAVTPPAGFEIPSNGINYSASLSLPAVGGTVSVRIPASAASGSSPSGNITLVSSPALSRTVVVSGAVTAANSPAVSCSPTALTGFSTYAGSVSTAQTITVSGTYLTDSVVVTAASGYEVSADNTTFSSSVSITQSGGTLGGTPVYVRVGGTASAGPLSGNAASVSSVGSPVVNVSGSGTVSTPSFGLLLSPNPVNEGASSTGTVSIPQARIADLVVSLASASTSAVTVPLSVTIPAGSTSATFQATAVDNPSSYAETSSSISVSATGVTGASVTLIVNNSTLAPITPISLDGSDSNSYSQNFDGLGTNSVPSVFPASNGVQVSLGAITTNTVNGWYGAKIAGTGTSATDLLANAGTTSTGTLYSFGNANDTNRALGTIATGTTTMAFGALIKNDTGGTITNVKVSFTAEFWRSSTASSNNVLTFGYGTINGTNSTEKNFLTTTGATPFTALNITGPAPVTSNGSLDGNSPANQVAYSNVALPLELGVGKTAFLRWQDLNDGGDDAGIGMDNFTLSYEVDRTVTLSSFTPSAGPFNTQVTIRGVNFTAGMPVKFNGTAASLVSMVSSTELAVTVPAGATTGYVTVGEGSAAVTSATAFVVGNFSGDPTVSGTNFENVSVGSVADKYMMLNGGGLPGLTLDLAFDQPDFLLSEDGSTFASTLSVSLSNGSVSYVFPALRFAPTSTGAKTAVLTISSGGIVIGKYTFTGAGTGLTQPTYFSGYGQNGRAALYWGSDPSYDLVILGKNGSSVADAPTASGSYTGNTTFGSGTPVGSSTTIFSGFDSSVSNKVVTGLNNNQFYYFKIFNRNPSTNVVSVGKEIRVMPYADITEGVITRWNFNNSDLSAITGSGTVEAVGGVAAGLVNGVGGSSDRATINKAVSVKGATGQFTGLQFAVSTVGKKEVKVFWDIAASGSASKYTKFQYTLDVTATPPVWVDYTPTVGDSPGVAIESGLYALDKVDSTLLQRSADLSGVPGAQNNAKFGFRVISAYAPGTSAIARADGTSAAYSTAGTVKYDMVTVTGVDGVFGTPLSNYLNGFNLTGDDALGTADPDGDGMNNNAEFAFGTSPISGASRAVTQTSVADGIKITWLQRSGVTYEVKSTDNLGSAFSVPVSSNLVSPQPDGLGDYQQYEATLTGGDRGFIKIEAFVP